MNYLFKQNKAITLIALVISIIIILLLAGTSISALTGENGLLKKVGKSKDVSEEANFIEEINLLKIEYEIDKKDGKYTGNLDDYILEKKYGIQLGAIVNYNPLSNGQQTYLTNTSKGVAKSVGTKDTSTGKYSLTEGTFKTDNLTWRVLGINNKGQLELISENPTNGPYLANEEGFLYGPDELDVMCNTLYGKGNGALSARNLNVDDIDKLAGIITFEDKKKIDSGYGNIHQFRFPTEEEVTGERKLQERVNSGSGYGNWKNSHYANTYKLPEQSISISIENPGYSKELIQDYYKYTISEKISRTTSDGKKLSDILCKGTKSSTNITQWLSSKCTNSYLWTTFRVRYIYNDTLDGAVVCTSSGNNYLCYKIRPVVTLNSNIQLSDFIN